MWFYRRLEHVSNEEFLKNMNEKEICTQNQKEKISGLYNEEKGLGVSDTGNTEDKGVRTKHQVTYLTFFV